MVHGVDNIVTDYPEAASFNIPVLNVEYIFLRGSMATIQTRQSLTRLICADLNSFIFSGFDRLWWTSFDTVSIRRDLIVARRTVHTVQTVSRWT